MVALSVSCFDHEVNYSANEGKPYGTDNFKKNIPRSVRLALFLFPLGDTTLCHGRAHRWHAEFGERMTAR